jgi:type IV pilus assembly protein PilW
MMPFFNTQRGMTLIEITVALAVTSIVAAAIFATYRVQKMTHQTQRALVEMNQNIRSAVYFLSRDLRMAGADPQWGSTGNSDGSGAAILTANAGSIQFQVDWDKSGAIDQPDETIRYALTNDADGDGEADGFPCHLGRQIGGGNLEIIAENIEEIDFEYLGYSATPPYQAVSLNALGANVTAAQIDDIRFVRVTILARDGDHAPAMSWKQTDSGTYANAMGDRVLLNNPGDQIRRSVLTTEIQMRNL